MKKTGSVLGGTLLITGSCIGTGMLGLPILTGIAGFIPSLAMFVLAWLFMTVSALLMVEVLGWFKKPVNMISMVDTTLGSVGKFSCWILYLFLFYALLVAYMSASGSHVHLLLQHLFHVSISHWAGTFVFVVLFGWIVYLGAKSVDHVNRYLMIGKIVSYLALVVFGIKHITPHLLLHWDAKYALFSFPILIISFGFQNMVPVLMEYMGGDRRRVRRTIYAGSIFTFVVYLIWELVALGVLPFSEILHSYHQDVDAAQSLRLYAASKSIGYAAQGLAFFAILTSFLAQTISITHFLGDGFKLQKGKCEHIGMCLLALIPPLIFTKLFPELFFKAINFAGGICAILLFGVLPALMVWIGRYQKRQFLADRVPGGRLVLLVMLVVGIFIFSYEAAVMIGLPIFPKP